MWRHDRELRRRAAELLTSFGLAQFARRRPGALPYGIQRRLELARAMAAAPRLLLLDEPAAGLNGEEQRQLAAIVRSIRDSGVTVVLIEHNMGLVMSLCERVVVLDSGTVIAEGTPAEVARHPAVLEAYLGNVRPAAGIAIAVSGTVSVGGAFVTGTRPSAAALTVENLAVRYGGVSAVRSVSFTVAPGQSVGLIGANGAGKTSTLRALMGLVPRAGGTVRFGDRGPDPGPGPEHGAAGHRLRPGRPPRLRRADAWRRTCCSARTRAAGTRRRGRPSARCTSCSRYSRRCAGGWPARCPAASSRCWPSAGR